MLGMRVLSHHKFGQSDNTRSFHRPVSRSCPACPSTETCRKCCFCLSSSAGCTSQPRPLIHSFIQQILYPLYFTFINPQHPRPRLTSAVPSLSRLRKASLPRPDENSSSRSWGKTLLDSQDSSPLPPPLSFRLVLGSGRRNTPHCGALPQAATPVRRTRCIIAAPVTVMPCGVWGLSARGQILIPEPGGEIFFVFCRLFFLAPPISDFLTAPEGGWSNLVF